MIVVKNLSIAAALLTGAAQHALAAPIASSDLVLRSGAGVINEAVLGARAVDIEYPGLEERKVNGKRLLHNSARVGKGLSKILLRDLETDKNFELSEQMMAVEIEGRDLEERKINRKKLLRGAAKVGKGLLKLLLRNGDLKERDVQFDERDLEYVFARYLQDGE
ncbi:unnamed protein product [Clonostachys byssicola]|uniref:Uncharacterized protein n=1 Tax=Clonostachys byssicola TaxID=160290 RepID=A0A9N9UE63_9HYPO|nr:unnamed protein product [Clonostachys byssicola]